MTQLCGVGLTCRPDRARLTFGREPACLASTEAGPLPDAVPRDNVWRDPSPSPSKQSCQDHPSTVFVFGPASQGRSLACAFPAHTRDVPQRPGIVHSECRDANQSATRKAERPGNKYRLRWSPPVPELVPDSHSPESSVAASSPFSEGPPGKVPAPKVSRLQNR